MIIHICRLWQSKYDFYEINLSDYWMNSWIQLPLTLFLPNVTIRFRIFVCFFFVAKYEISLKIWDFNYNSLAAFNRIFQRKSYNRIHYYGSADENDSSNESNPDSVTNNAEGFEAVSTNLNSDELAGDLLDFTKTILEADANLHSEVQFSSVIS